MLRFLDDAIRKAHRERFMSTTRLSWLLAYNLRYLDEVTVKLKIVGKRKRQAS